MMRADTPSDAQGDTLATRKKNILGQVREVLRSSPRGHSPLFLWMRANHDDLAAAFAANPPNWQQLSEIFRDERLTDRTGKPPSPAIARLTWYRVRQAVAKMEAEARRRSPATPPVVGVTTPLPSTAPTASSRPRVGSQAVEPPPVAPTDAPAVAITATERLRAFRARLNEGKVRIPEPINPAKSRGETDGET